METALNYFKRMENLLNTVGVLAKCYTTFNSLYLTNVNGRAIMITHGLYTNLYQKVYGCMILELLTNSVGMWKSVWCETGRSWVQIDG